MKADEARQIAKSSNIGSAMQEIKGLIKSTAEKGEYSAWYYGLVKDDVRKALQMDGYTVGETQFERNEHMTKISWDRI
jgi:hypothetical protein